MQFGLFAAGDHVDVIAAAQAMVEDVEEAVGVRRIVDAYDFAAALVQGLGGHVRQVRVDRLVEGIYAATVEVEGPLGAQSVDARPSDALNLAAITDARVFIGPELVNGFERLQDDDSAEARLLRLALTVPHMRITRVTERDLLLRRT